MRLGPGAGLATFYWVWCAKNVLKLAFLVGWLRGWPRLALARALEALRGLSLWLHEPLALATAAARVLPDGVGHRGWSLPVPDN